MPLGYSQGKTNRLMEEDPETHHKASTEMHHGSKNKYTFWFFPPAVSVICFSESTTVTFLSITVWMPHCYYLHSYWTKMSRCSPEKKY